MTRAAGPAVAEELRNHLRVMREHAACTAEAASAHHRLLLERRGLLALAPEQAAPPGPWERIAEPATDPFLRSHVLAGRAVVPVAMILEWLAEAAAAASPAGLQVLGVDGLDLFKGLTLDAEAQCRIQIDTGPPTETAGVLAVPATMRVGARPHARAVVLLGEAGSPPPSDIAPVSGGWTGTAAQIYPGLLFHGPLFQSIDAITGSSATGISATLRRVPDRPADWLRAPRRDRWLTAPLIADTGFQLTALWNRCVRTDPSLPNRLGAYRQYAPDPAARITAAHARITPNGALRASADIDFVDEAGTVVVALRGAESTAAPALAGAFAQNAL